MRLTQRGRAAALLIGGVIVLVLLAGTHDALAQGNPFGAPRPAPESGVIGWILAKQSEFYRALSGLIRAAKTDGTAVWGLFGISFLYGIFHAAGPGHGKAVISSYLIANEETWTRGVTLSFASALLQAVVAVLVVGIAAVLLGATAKMMGDTVRVIETASYALIAAFGARLTWVKGREFLAAWRGEPAGHPHHGSHDHGSHQHDRQQDHRHDPECHHRNDHAAAGPEQAHAHAHEHRHDHDEHARRGHDHHGHSHGPEPQDLAGPGGWQRGLTAIIAVGLRPCSGAILVLVFALAQGLFWAGVVSTFIMGLGTALTVAVIATLAVAAKGLAGRIAAQREGSGALVLRGIEAGAAFLVLIFGLALLAGYMASERIMGF